MALPLPDRASLDAALKRADERRAFWDAHRAALIREYPDEFVAVAHGTVVDHDPDLMSLVQRLRAAGHDMRELWTEYMATERHKLIL